MKKEKGTENEEGVVKTVGILCEKPSQARNFAKALGGGAGTYNGERYVIAAARGHLYEFVEPGKQVAPDLSKGYSTWSVGLLPWNPEDFRWIKKPKKGAEQTLAQIKKQLSECEEIAIGTDYDLTGEGDLLAWEILDGLEFAPKKWSRMRFEDEAPASIRKAFEQRVPVPSRDSDPNYAKANYRSRWDFMSMQWTRVASCLTKIKLRQGRLKSYIVVIVGDALKALREYKEVPFYQWRFRDENGVVYTSQDEERYPNEGDVPAGAYSASEVVVDSTERKAKPPEKLPDIARISAILASQGVRASKVLEVYQAMYEDQVVSYPRTEDKVITPEQFQELLPLAGKIARVVGVDEALLTHKAPRPTHVKTGGAHGANRPGPNVPESLDSLRKYGECAPAIYELLAKAYLAMLCEDYVYTHQKGHVKNYPSFKGSANCPVSMGYKAVFVSEDPSEEPEVLLGTKGEPFVFRGLPPKPPVPTVKWMMSQLEKRRVGTGATRTSTYAEMSQESESALLSEKRGRIALTKAGEISYLLLQGTHIGSVETTEQVYMDMDAVAKGTAQAKDLLGGVARLVVEDIETMKRNMPSVAEAFPEAATMPKERAEGVYAPTNEKVSFAREWSGHRFTDAETNLLLKGEKISFPCVSSKTGRSFEAEGSLQKQVYKGREFWSFAMERSECPPDKVEGLYKGKKEVRFKVEFSGHRFTSEEVEQLLSGKEISFDAVSKAGKPYTVKGSLKEQVYNGTKFWGFKPDFGKR